MTLACLPQQNPVRVRLWLEGRGGGSGGGRRLGRKLLDAEKITFRTDAEGELRTAGQVGVL